MESEQIAPETVTWTDRFLKVAQHLPPADAFAIAAFIDELVEEEKRKEAIAFQEWAADRGWLLHPDCDEDEERAWYKPSDDFDIPDELKFGGQLYDLYLLSLTQLNKEL